MVSFAGTKSNNTAVDTAFDTASAIASGIDTENSINVAVAGATGYVGQELIKLLLTHPAVKQVSVASKSHDGELYEDVLPAFRETSYADKLNNVCSAADLNLLARSNDVLFLALPHGKAGMTVTAEILKSTKIIDLSGDFRLKNADIRNTWYGSAGGDDAICRDAVYGLCELNRKEIASAQIIANPGCYATAAILALMPLVKSGLISANSIIIDGKSGVSGAGRAASLQTQFGECNESMKAYQIPSHRHAPEIEQALSAFTTDDIITTFAAHLVPMNRGILLTAYATLTGPITNEEVQSTYDACYGNEAFVRLMPAGASSFNLPETRWVKGSNYCDIGFAVDRRSNRIVVVSAIDNLIKGAAGQAVQNMNILLGIDETTGLKQIPVFL